MYLNVYIKLVLKVFLKLRTVLTIILLSCQITLIMLKRHLRQNILKDPGLIPKAIKNNMGR